MLNKGYFNSIYDYITITIISDISNSLNRNVENRRGNMEIYTVVSDYINTMKTTL